MKKMILVSLCAIALSGCAVPIVEKDLVPVGGNKAGATVKMAYNYTYGEETKVDYLKARQEAAKTCKVWGYKDAREFGGQSQRCVNSFNQNYYGGAYYTNGYYGCSEYEVTVEYQCY